MSTDVAPLPGPSADGTAPSDEAAFFDVDNTIMRGASIVYVARLMYARKVFKVRDAARFGIHQLMYSLRGEKLSDVTAIRDRGMELVKGIRAEDVVTLGDEVFDQSIAQRIWPGTQALAEHHLSLDRRVWLVTATPIEVANTIAERLGLTGALGTVGEVVDGVYTGRLSGGILHGPAKADAIQRLAEQEGLDLQKCWAYSDSHNDIPLLSTVGNPVAINPDARLRRHAKAANWPVYDFRSGRRAATLGLRAATLGGVVYGLWKGFSHVRRPGR